MNSGDFVAVFNSCSKAAAADVLVRRRSRCEVRPPVANQASARTRTLVKVLGGLLLAMGAPALAGAPADDAANLPKADPAVGLALDELKANYEVVDDGDYKLTIGFDDKRSQVVFVSSVVETLGKMTVREVWAIANLYVPGNEPAELAVELLKDAAGKILGGWQLREFGDRTGLVYCMQLPAGIDAVGLRTAYEQTAVIVDEKEKEITGGKDDF